MSVTSILVVEDEPEVRAMLLRVLRDGGFAGVGVPDGRRALDAIAESLPALILLDINLPGGINGEELCRHVRENPDTAGIGLIALTGMVSEAWEIAMLDAGVDDYIQKGRFRPELLLRRIGAVLRRTQPEGSEEIRIGPLWISELKREARVDGESLPLTPTEFDVLLRLAKDAGTPVERSELLDRGDDGPVDRSVDVHILSLRRKLGDHRGLIRTIWGMGYRLG